MNCSVKFLEPMVIVGLLALAGLDWMTFGLAAAVVDAAVDWPAFVLPLLLSSSLPHAARPNVARTSTSNARTLRERMRRFLLGVGVCCESLSPRGVTARWIAEKSNSAPIASSATRSAVPRRPASPWTFALMIGTPSVSTPTYGPNVAVASTLTTEVRMPPKTSGRARGSWTRSASWRSESPMPRAASTTSRSTWRTPT